MACIKARNQNRACLAEQAIAAMDEGGDVGIVDVLTNLRFLCDRDGYDFAELDKMAHQHYLVER